MGGEGGAWGWNAGGELREKRSGPGTGVQAREGTWQSILRAACHMKSWVPLSKACVDQRETQTLGKVYMSLVAQ